MLRSPTRPLITLGLLLAAAAAQAQAPDWKKIRIGVEGAYPPFSQIGPDGKVIGFEIDLAMAYCAYLKAECTLVQQEFDGMIPALQSRKFDVIIASMSITEPRSKVIAFSVPYINNPAHFVGKANVPFTMTAAGLKGKRIGVQRSTTHAAYVKNTYTQSEVVLYATQDQIFLDLKAGRIDLALADQVAIDTGFLSKPDGKGFAFVGEPVDGPIFGLGSGVGMRKSDAATLAPKFNAAIEAISKDGTFKKINAKYFPYSIDPRAKK